MCHYFKYNFRNSILIKTLTYNNVEFGVNVDQLSVLVDDGQRRNSLVHELPKSLDDRHRVIADLDVFVASDAQVVDGLGEVLRLR